VADFKYLCNQSLRRPYISPRSNQQSTGVRVTSYCIIGDTALQPAMLPIVQDASKSPGIEAFICFISHQNSLLPLQTSPSIREF